MKKVGFLSVVLCFLVLLSPVSRAESKIDLGYTATAEVGSSKPLKLNLGSEINVRRDTRLSDFELVGLLDTGFAPGENVDVSWGGSGNLAFFTSTQLLQQTFSAERIDKSQFFASSAEIATSLTSSTTLSLSRNPLLAHTASASWQYASVEVQNESSKTQFSEVITYSITDAISWRVSDQFSLQLSTGFESVDLEVDKFNIGLGFARSLERSQLSLLVSDEFIRGSSHKSEQLGVNAIYRYAHPDFIFQFSALKQVANSVQALDSVAVDLELTEDTLSSISALSIGMTEIEFAEAVGVSVSITVGEREQFLSYGELDETREQADTFASAEVAFVSLAQQGFRLEAAGLAEYADSTWENGQRLGLKRNFFSNIQLAFDLAQKQGEFDWLVSLDFSN